MTMSTPPTSASMRAMLFSMALSAGITGCHRANQNTDAVADSEPALSSDTGTVVGTDSDTATGGVITDNDTTTGVTTDSDTATGVTTDSDTESEAYIDTCPGALDFTPCQVVTDPDRSYDICNSGVCRSPGCGERACNVPGPAFPISDTGLTLCYGYDITPIECPGVAGSDECASIPFCGQDAQYRHDLPDRFTRITEVPDRPMVEDSLTGLTWQGCMWGAFGDDCEMNDPDAVGDGDGDSIWSSGTELTRDPGTPLMGDYQRSLNRCQISTWAGFKDWRLPSPYELVSLFDRLGEETALSLVAFPNISSDYHLWASSFTQSNDAIRVAADTGYAISGENDSTYNLYTLCARGGPAVVVAERFTSGMPAADQPVVQDNVTTLSWQGCPAGLSGVDCSMGEAFELSFEEALSYCEGLTWAGLSDWRLPDVHQLHSIVDERVDDPAIDETAFPGTPADFFWTSTSDPTPPWDSSIAIGSGFTVLFEHGDIRLVSKPPIDNLDAGGDPFWSTNGLFHVRCVRGG